MALHRCFSPGIIVGGEAFTPASIASCVHWWDAELSAKTGSPGDISQINDLIGTDHLVQATGSDQPDDNTRTINGLTAFDFDGDDQLAVTSALDITTAFHVFIVAQFDVLTAAAFLVNAGPSFNLNTNDGWSLGLDESVGGSGRLALRVSNGTGVDDFVASASLVVGTAGPHLIEAWSVGTTEMGIAIDGVEEINSSMSFGCSGPDEFVMMARAAGGLNNFNGAWGMTVLFDAKVTGNDHDNMLAYATSRWGVP